MLEQFGLNIDPQVFQPSALLSGQDMQETGSDSDSNTTTNSVVDAAIPLSKSPSTFAPLASLPNHVDQRQLMLALSQLNQFNQEMRNVGSLNTTNQLAANFVHSKTVTTIDALGDDKEEKQSRTSPTIKRPLEDNENLMRLFTNKKRRMNGIFGNQTVDEKWKRDMLEVCCLNRLFCKTNAFATQMNDTFSFKRLFCYPKNRLLLGTPISILLYF